MNLILNFDKAIEKIQNSNYSIVGLQLPEGLKPKAYSIAQDIEKQCNCKVIINAESCFGACDLADEKLKFFGTQVLLHVGHLPILKKTAIPVIYVEGTYETKLDFQNIENKIKEDKIALITTAQYLNLLDKVKLELKKHKKTCLISKKTTRTPIDGQILGCDFSTLDNIKGEFNAILFIGDGLFHPIGAAIYTSKPVYVYRPHSKTISLLEQSFKDNFLRKRFALIDTASKCKTFGVAVSRKAGQNRTTLAMKIVEKIKKIGKIAFLIEADNINTKPLINLGLDCYINTACPRITFDGVPGLNKPVISPIEAEIALGLKKWGDFKIDSLAK